MTIICRLIEMAIIFVGLICLWIIYISEKKIDENKEIIQIQEDMIDTNSTLIDRQDTIIARQLKILNIHKDALYLNDNLVKSYKKMWMICLFN
jgi:flagellar motility protein MotE (MotC chaperone)